MKEQGTAGPAGRASHSERREFFRLLTLLLFCHLVKARVATRLTIRTEVAYACHLDNSIVNVTRQTSYCTDAGRPSPRLRAITIGPEH